MTAAPEVVIAAGMLEAAGVLDESLTRDQAAQRLAELLGDTTLWRRADLGADLRSPLTAVRPVPATEWLAPPEPVPQHLGEVLSVAWTDAVRITVRGRPRGRSPLPRESCGSRSAVSTTPTGSPRSATPAA